MTVNWTGTFANTLGTGTCTGGDSNTTLTNTGATFDTSPELAGWTCRILSGLGSGQERVITSNTATVLTVSPAWTTTPDNTSVYEVVAILKNGDSVTGAFSLGNGTFTEIEDSATITVTGTYAITLTGTATVRWNKTATTLATICAANRTTTGAMAFWTGIVLSVTTTGTATIKYLKVQDASIGLSVTTAVGLAQSANISNLWFDGCTTPIALGTTAPTANSEFAEIYVSNGSTGKLGFTNQDFEYSQTYSRCWMHSSSSAPSIAVYQPKNILLQQIRDCVHKRSSGVQAGPATVTAANTSYVIRVQDSYAFTGAGAFTTISCSATDSGTRIVTRCDLNGSGLSGTTLGSATGISRFNDWITRCGSVSNKLFNDTPGFTALTSHSDYIAGYAAAAQANVDTVEGATVSSASPVQWGTLTANRTSAKSVRNRPLSIDNVAEPVPTSTACTITGDSAQGAVAGQGSTTVDAESSAAQAVLSVTATTGFEVGELVEIAYGTVAFELLRVLSINAGVSLTLETNLVNTHAIGVTVTKHLRHMGIPFVKYGTATGVLTMSTPLPAEDDRGLVYTKIQQTFNGKTHSYQRYAHSVALTGLCAGTTYYYKLCAYTPLGELMESAEGSFTTAASDQHSDPGVGHVRQGVEYKFGSGSNNRTGTLQGSVHVI